LGGGEEEKCFTNSKAVTNSSEEGNGFTPFSLAGTVLTNDASRALLTYAQQRSQHCTLIFCDTIVTVKLEDVLVSLGRVEKSERYGWR
jgi:hypothetical protein